MMFQVNSQSDGSQYGRHVAGYVHMSLKWSPVQAPVCLHEAVWHIRITSILMMIRKCGHTCCRLACIISKIEQQFIQNCSKWLKLLKESLNCTHSVYKRHDMTILIQRGTEVGEAKGNMHVFSCSSCQCLGHTKNFIPVLKENESRYV